MKESWRIMEQLECIAVHQPVFAGDLISNDYEKELRKAKLVKRDKNGESVLTLRGQLLWKLWKGVYSEGGI